VGLKPNIKQLSDIGFPSNRPPRGLDCAEQGLGRDGISGAATTVKIISWNLLRLTGASGNDVAALIDRHRPDLVLLQEATEDLAELPTLIGGYFHRQPMEGRVYGLAAWSAEWLPMPLALPLPVSQVPGRVPPRIAQIVQLGGVTFAKCSSLAWPMAESLAIAAHRQRP
jgi:hypothetical protein